jgi:hypothetical protein
MKKYTKEQILIAGEIGEVSMIDVRHVASLLDEAVILEHERSGRAGCVHNTLNYIGPWYSCKDCGLHFNARAEAPPEGDLTF